MKKAIISDQISFDIEDAFKKAKSLGYRYVEIHSAYGKSIEDCSIDEIQKIKTLLDTYHLEVANIASTIFFLCPLYPHYKISLFNPEFYVTKGGVKEHLEALHRACIVANTLKCATVRIFPFRFPDNNDIKIVGTEEDIQEIIKHLQEAVAIAKKYDVTLVLENCPYSHLPKGEMTFEVINTINDPSLQLLWDPANSYRAEKHKVPEKYKELSLEDEYALIKDSVGHIHLKNYTYDETQDKPFVHRSLLKGDINYSSLIPYINKSYDRYFSLEPEVPYDETIQSMKDLLSII